MRWLLLAALLAGCRHDLDEVDTIYYAGGTRQVHCAVDIDTRTHNSLASIDTGLDRARDRGEIIELYAHKPGDTVPIDTIEHVLTGARDRGLPFYTYADFAAGTASGAGIAMSFDDASVDLWTQIRPIFDASHARITFFVSRYAAMTADEHAELRALADDGHAIEAHSVNHLHAPDYVERNGLGDYLANEAVPSIDALRTDGYDVQAFAYPFGLRTGELDRALLEHVPILRSVTYAWDPVESPCPL